MHAEFSNRQRDLLPLPLFATDDPFGKQQVPQRAGLSKGAYRRLVRHNENVAKANEAIKAVNSLAGLKFANQESPSVVQST